MEQAMDSHFEKMMSIMDAYYDRLRAIIKEYLETTEAKREPTPEEREVVVKP
jgi:hypothetical protein